MAKKLNKLKKFYLGLKKDMPDFAQEEIKKLDRKHKLKLKRQRKGICRNKG